MLKLVYPDYAPEPPTTDFDFLDDDDDLAPGELRSALCENLMPEPTRDCEAAD